MRGEDDPGVAVGRVAPELAPGQLGRGVGLGAAVLQVVDLGDEFGEQLRGNPQAVARGLAGQCVALRNLDAPRRLYVRTPTRRNHHHAQLIHEAVDLPRPLEDEEEARRHGVTLSTEGRAVAREREEDGEADANEGLAGTAGGVDAHEAVRAAGEGVRALGVIAAAVLTPPALVVAIERVLELVRVSALAGLALVVLVRALLALEAHLLVIVWVLERLAQPLGSLSAGLRGSH